VDLHPVEEGDVKSTGQSAAITGALALSPEDPSDPSASSSSTYNGRKQQQVRCRVRSADTASYHAAPAAIDILEGFLGALYQRRFFDLPTLVREQLPPVPCFTTDDIWIAQHLASRGVPRLKLPMPFERPKETAADKVAPLRADNVHGASKNDVCAALVLPQLVTWRWQPPGKPAPCAARLQPFLEPLPSRVEAAFEARANYPNETRSPCNLQPVAVASLPRPCATRTSVPFGAALLPDQLLVSADFPDSYYDDSPDTGRRNSSSRSTSGSKMGYGDSDGLLPPPCPSHGGPLLPKACLLWTNYDSLEGSHHSSALHRNLPPLGAYVLWNHGAGNLVQYRRWATAAPSNSQSGSSRDSGTTLQQQRRGSVNDDEDSGEAAGSALAGVPPCVVPTWLDWLTGRYGATEVWKLQRPRVPTPAQDGKFPVQQRAYLALASRGGGLELRLGMPWAGRSERALHTLGARYGEEDLSSSDERSGSVNKRRRKSDADRRSRGGDEGSGSRTAPDGSSSSLSSSSRRRPSTPGGYRSVLRLHRSGALCVLLERAGVGKGELMQ